MNVLVLSQDHNIYKGYQIGFSPNFLNRAVGDSESLKNDVFKFNNDNGFLIGYEYRLFKGINTYLYAAYETSKSRYDYEPFMDYIIYTEQRRNSFHFGVRKKVPLLKEKLNLGFGFGIAKRHYKEAVQRYYGVWEFNNSNEMTLMEYRLTTFHDGTYTKGGFTPYRNRFNFNSDLTLSYKLNDIVSFRLNALYSQNHYVFYVFRYISSTFEGNQPVLTGSINGGYIGDLNNTYFSKNNILHINLGLQISLDALKHNSSRDD